MRFWKRRKKAKEQPEAKQNIEDVLEHLNTRGAYTDSAEYKRQAEHEMLGRCEEIIEAIRELEEAKSEYRIVTDYLNDIQKIRKLPLGRQLRTGAQSACVDIVFQFLCQGKIKCFFITR